MAEMESYRYTGSNPRVLFHKMRLPGELVECTEAQAAQVNDETPGLLVPVEESADAIVQEDVVFKLGSAPAIDPAEMTVTEIKALELTPEQWSELLDLEREGKARVTVIDYAEQRSPTVPAGLRREGAHSTGMASEEPE